MMTHVARLYHLQGVRQPEIAARLDLSQAKVSRLLKKAQERGIVRITVTPPSGTHPDLEDGLQERYGLKLALVVETAPDNERTMLGDLGAAAAYYLQTTLRSGDTVGISSWSATLLATVQAMQPVPGLKDVSIVQAVGGIGDPAAAGHASQMTGQLARLVNGEAVYLQAPGVAGSAESAEALRGDPFVSAALGELGDLDVVLVGIGEITPSSTLARSGNAFSDVERAELAKLGAVGDVCLRFYDERGRPVRFELDSRVVGITREQLAAGRRKIGVAGGRRKHRAIRAAVTGGLVDVLVTDQETAAALMA
ncbi:sugar-binding transcriptional regulator [Streptomyces sp. PLAI1-29]|uniref:Sugar-binding transcriptional regulator n=2 Tax=Streptomyces zingiberis TaxID=2053010 RepID=A0ABX1C515_9ACTN|nr:sugar-binding transcriptional regulator [Streptomyces zingiberis]